MLSRETVGWTMTLSLSQLVDSGAHKKTIPHETIAGMGSEYLFPRDAAPKVLLCHDTVWCAMTVWSCHVSRPDGEYFFLLQIGLAEENLFEHLHTHTRTEQPTLLSGTTSSN